jgi:hypothetical protein
MAPMRERLRQVGGVLFGSAVLQVRVVEIRCL